MRNGNLFVISGPSGAGKGTLVAQLMQRVPDAWLSVSATTRAPRTGEVDGVHYHFLSVQRFEELIQEDGFLEWARYGDNYYGTPRADVETRIASGQQVILEIEVQGAFQVKEKLPQAHLIFIEPPSLEELERRLRNRATDSEEAIQKRMQTAELELLRSKEYDVQLINDNLDETVARLVAFVTTQAEKERG